MSYLVNKQAQEQLAFTKKENLPDMADYQTQNFDLSFEFFAGLYAKSPKHSFAYQII